MVTGGNRPAEVGRAGEAPKMVPECVTLAAGKMCAQQQKRGMKGRCQKPER